MASGDILCAWKPIEADWPASGAAATSRDVDYGFFNVFPEGSDAYVIFGGRLPDHYAGGGVTLTIEYLMDSANTTDDAILSAAFQRLADGVDLSGSVSWTPNTTTETVPDAAEEFDVATITFTDGTDMASVAAGELFRLRVGRVGSSGSDTAAGNLRGMGYVLRET